MMKLNRNISGILEAAGNPYCIIRREADGVFNIVQTNEAFLELLQLSEENLQAAGLAQTFNFLDNLSDLSEALEQSYIQGHTETLELKHRRSGTIDVCWYTKCIPLLDQDGNTETVILQINHISKESADNDPLPEAALAALRFRSDKYKEILKSVSQPMWIYDVGTLFFLDVNEAAITHYGYSYNEFMIMTIKDIRPEADIPAMEAAVSKLKRFKELFTKQVFRHRKKNGELIHVELSSTLIEVLGRKCAIVLINDISVQVAATRTIAAYQDRVMLAQQLSQVGYWELDTSTRKAFWSEEMYAIWEYDLSLPAPTPDLFEQTVHPEDLDIFLGYRKRILEEGDLTNCEFRILTTTGVCKYVRIQISVSPDKQQQRIVKGTVQDITRQKEAELMLQARSELLETTGNFNKCLLENLPWEARLQEALALVGKVLGADRVYYFEHITDTYTGNSSVLLESSWQASGNVVPGLDRILDQFLGYFLVTLASKQHALLQVPQLPEGTPLKEAAASVGILSLRALPIFVNELFHGFLAVEYNHKVKTWSDAEVSFLEAINNSLRIAIKRHIAEAAVRESQQQFKSLVNNVPGITYRCLLDESWTMLFISDEVERLLGYKAEDFIYNQLRTFASVIHPEDLAKGTSRIESELSRRGRFISTYRLLTAAGEVIWVEDRGISSYDKHGKLLWIDGVVLEISGKPE